MKVTGASTDFLDEASTQMCKLSSAANVVHPNLEPALDGGLEEVCAQLHGVLMRGFLLRLTASIDDEPHDIPYTRS